MTNKTSDIISARAPVCVLCPFVRFFTGFLSSRLLLGLLSGEFRQAFDCLQEKRQAVSAEIQTNLDMFWEAI